MSVELSPPGERGHQYQSPRRLLRAGSTQTLFPMLGRLYRLLDTNTYGAYITREASDIDV